jgi:hypothetical protein
VENIAFSGADKATRYRELLPQLATFDDGDVAGLAPIAELLGSLSW